LPKDSKILGTGDVSVFQSPIAQYFNSSMVKSLGAVIAFDYSIGYA
jgi:hypothetical protein